MDVDLQAGRVGGFHILKGGWFGASEAIQGEITEEGWANEMMWAAQWDPPVISKSPVPTRWTNLIWKAVKSEFCIKVNEG